jgi:hypothetical protein
MTRLAGLMVRQIRPLSKGFSIYKTPSKKGRLIYIYIYMKELKGLKKNKIRGGRLKCYLGLEQKKKRKKERKKK